MLLRRKYRCPGVRIRGLLLTPPLVALGFLLYTVVIPEPLPLKEENHPVENHPEMGAMGLVVPSTLTIWVRVLESQQDQLEPLVTGNALPFGEDGLLAISWPRMGPGRGKRTRQGQYRVVKPHKRQGGPTSPLVLPQNVSLTQQKGEPSPSVDISVPGELPESRHPLCLKQWYGTVLPSASVVICFRDEAWPVLRRTIRSVLDTVPRHLLQELVLVDDLSQPGPLKLVLSRYISREEGMRLIRSSRRLGVLGGRMLGAARSTGQVLVFMDSACQCHPGWLEPLLSRIAKNRSRVVSPALDEVDPRTGQYRRTSAPQRRVFDWSLDVHWGAVREDGEAAARNPTSPTRSPVAPGGVLAVDRRFFQNIGGYNAGLSMWGAEDLELSLRVWLCGGSVEILPCSRVGLVPKDREPQTFSDHQAALRSKMWAAETWLDTYRETFYKHNSEASLLLKTDPEAAHWAQNQQLLKRPGCRPFQWFLSTLLPELRPPEDRI